MIKSKTKRKTFKYNDDYFEFYEKMKDKIRVITVEIHKNKIVLEYEVLANLTKEDNNSE